MWELDGKEGWVLKNWCFQIVVLEKTLESPLDCKEIKPVNPKGNQPWIFIGRTDAKAEAPMLWPSDAKSWLIRKDPDAGKDWRQKKKLAEMEMVRQYVRLNGYKFEQTRGDGGGQSSLGCCSPWGHRVRQDLVNEQQQGPFLEVIPDWLLYNVLLSMTDDTVLYSWSTEFLENSTVVSSIIKIVSTGSPQTQFLYIERKSQNVVSQSV